MSSDALKSFQSAKKLNPHVVYHGFGYFLHSHIQVINATAWAVEEKAFPQEKGPRGR